MHYSKVGQYSKAIEDCSTALGLEPGSPYALDMYITRGFSFGELGKHTHALDDCNKALELESDKGCHYERKEAYKVRGTIYKYLKQYDKAKEDYNKALELDSEYEEVRECLDEILNEI